MGRGKRRSLARRFSLASSVLVFIVTFILVALILLIIFSLSPEKERIKNLFINLGLSEEKRVLTGRQISTEAITLSLIPSRTNCVAPCAIFFDASGTTSTLTDKPFHELHYAWDFGNPSSGNFWNGRSKNTATGPMAAHVFESPGTYIVSMTVRDVDGTTRSQSSTITISDPNTVFSGTNTICISQTGDFSGCPAGAQQITTSDVNAAMSHIATGRRVLFRRGETWGPGSKSFGNILGPGILGAYGTCTNPDARGICSNAPIFRRFTFLFASGTDSRLGPETADWRIMDIHVDGDNVTEDCLEATGETDHMLFLRVRSVYCRGNIVFGSSQLNFYNGQGADHDVHHNLFVADSYLHRVWGTGGNGGYLLQIAAKGFAFMGSNADDSRGGEHVARLFYLDKAILSNNFMATPFNAKHILKMHAPVFNEDYANGWGGWENLVPPGTYSQKIIVSESEFNSSNDPAMPNNWAFVIGSEDSHTDQRVRDVIVERNLFRTVNGVTPINSQGFNVTIRNNIFDASNSFSNGGIMISNRSDITPPSDGHFIYGNTFYTQDTGTYRLVTAAAADRHTNVYVKNNLGYSSVSITITALSGVATEVSNNLVSAVANNPFLVSNPFYAQDFRLRGNSPAINFGTPVPSYDDFNRISRPQGSTWDAGAFENVSAGGGAVCGNNIRESGEVCDGSDLNGQTCVSQGFSGGSLSCLGNCLGFNTGACTTSVSGFTFSAGGDHGWNANTNASLDSLNRSNSSFYLALGDMSYGAAGTESRWCDTVKARLNLAYPFQLVAGNHEESGGPNGYIMNFAACLPDRMNSAGLYAGEYYFDYQNLVRVIMISPDLSIGGSAYDYFAGNSHYTWLSNTIDSARSAGIPWVVVGMHKNCITVGTKTCEIGTDLMNLLLSKKVDVILQGHDHTYQRSKQLACAQVNSYNASCVVDDGSDNRYTKGSGGVLVVSGVFGQSFYNVNAADSEAGYFASWMGLNSNPTNGFVRFAVNTTEISAQFVRSAGGTFSDSFRIVASSPGPSCTDGDTDGWNATAGGSCGSLEDCDDGSANINPGRSEVCGDGIDNNCAAGVDEGCGNGASFRFTAAGDYGVNSFSQAGLVELNRSNSSFHLALGDFMYAPGVETDFCNMVTSRLPANYPFELLVGNHEEDGTSYGHIMNFSLCLPDRLNVNGFYPVEYYFDYQNLIRVIMISPDLIVNGATYNYFVGNSNYTWLSNTIDSARSAGIPWVVVGMHKHCISAADLNFCEVGRDLQNLLLNKKVDLILEGHAHIYERSKQLNCATVNYFNASCIVDDGNDGVYAKGNGSVIVISGAFGRSTFNASLSPNESGYFVKTTGNNTYITHGFNLLDVNPMEISVRYVNTTGPFTDSFRIVSSGSLPSCTDADRDGWNATAGGSCGSLEDCDDGSASVRPGAAEICGNGVDEDCSGSDLSCPVCQLTSAYWSTTSATEGQQATLTVTGTNCDGQQIDFAVYEDDILGGENSSDDPATQRPSSATFSGGVAISTWTAQWQNDCGGLCNPPEWYFIATLASNSSQTIRSGLLTVNRAVIPCTDSDGDGYGIGDTSSCPQSGIDCNDSSSLIYPGALEVCNNIDDDCDSLIDEGVTNTYYRDADGDLYGDSSSSIQSCTQPAGYVANSLDCDDSHNNRTILRACNYDNVSCGTYSLCVESCFVPPPEICGNGVDENCDGADALCSSSLPLLIVYNPQNTTYKNKPVPLRFTASGASNCWYVLNGVRIDAACSTDISLRLSAGNYLLQIAANNSVGETLENRAFSVVITRKVRVKYSEFNSVTETTNLDDLTDTQLENVSLLLDNARDGKIEFLEPVNLSAGADSNDLVDLDASVNISFNRIEVLSEIMPALNKRARLTLKNLVFSIPRILRDTDLCSGCSIESYSLGVLIFQVPGFTVYSAEETPLTTQPPGDGGPGGGGGPSGPGQVKPVKNVSNGNSVTEKVTPTEEEGSLDPQQEGGQPHPLVENVQQNMWMILATIIAVLILVGVISWAIHHHHQEEIGKIAEEFQEQFKQ